MLVLANVFWGLSFPLIKAIIFSQVVNGVLLPVILVFMVKLVNKRDLMGDWVNSRFYNIVSWTSVVVLSGLTIVLMGLTIRDMYFP